MVKASCLRFILNTAQWAVCLRRPRLCYTIPVYNNPTGATIPVEQRMQLLQLAHKYGFIIVADEVYQMLSFKNSPPPPPPMRVVERNMFQQGLLGSSSSSSSSGGGGGGGSKGDDDQQQRGPAGMTGDSSTAFHSRVVSLGSFSKIMAPGLRLGWIDAGPQLLQRLRQDGVLGSGGSIAPLASGIAHSCIQLGSLQQHMHGTIRPTLQHNCAALCEVLRQKLPAGCHFRQPEGGYFVWLHLPEEVGNTARRAQ